MSSENRQPHDQSDIESAISAIGVWADENLDQMLDALDRIRHQGAPPPPVDLDI